MDWLFGILFDVIFSRVVATRPVMSRQGNGLIAKSDWRSQVISLGFGGRRVIVDPSQKFIRIAVRSFWFLRKYRTIGFDEVREICYGYNDWSIGWWTYQEMDLFTVSLLLNSGETVVLFRFFGEGDFVNNSWWPDFAYAGDYAMAALTRVDQSDNSHRFADILSSMIAVPIGNPPG